MRRISYIKNWYNNIVSDNRYFKDDIFLLYIPKDNTNNSYQLDTQEEQESNRYIIKKLSNIKNSDITIATESQKRLILYFDKPISLQSLSILKHSNYRYIYYDLGNNENQPLFIFQILEPRNTIENNLQHIIDFFDIFLSNSNNKKSIFSRTQINTFLLRNKHNISLETIQNDIKFLEHHNKLTSRLAIFIYKICTFKFTTSEKEIGLYFSRYLGKSKPLNKKSYDIKNVKGYDISKYSDNPIYNIKRQIAHRLFYMRNKQINRDTILEATGIDMDKIQNVQF